MKLVLAALVAVSALAQPQSPHAGYVYPAGGLRGATVEARVGGQFLSGAHKVYVSGKGVDAKVIEYLRPPSGAEAQKLRDEMQQLNQKRAASQRAASAGAERVVFTETDRTRAAEIRDKLEELQRRPSIPAIAEIARLQVTIAPDAAPGRRQLRLETPAGLTNPIAFEVGEFAEYARRPERVAPAYNVVNGGTPIVRLTAAAAEAPTEIALPAVVNGQMMPGRADRYRFRAAKGRRIVVAVSARDLTPYLSDAVPGWFQAAVAVRDRAGRLLASADHFRFRPDPLLAVVIPEDGEYQVEIHDSIYRGREDFVYRMTVGELPVITGMFPLGGKAGSRAKVELEGWNLSPGKRVEDLRRAAPGVYPISALAAFEVDRLPETAAKAEIGRREQAQRVKEPVVLNGRIRRPGERQFFRIDCRAGEEMVAEIMARRLGSPLDSTLRVTDSAGRQVAFNDDYDDKGSGLLTHQADSFVQFRATAKGAYYVEVADAQRKGGPQYAYRLRISRPRPDYELRVSPSTLNVRAGATVPFTVYALRRDGFNGEIALKVKDAPADFELSGGAVPAGQDRVRVTLTAPRTPVDRPLRIELVGEATIDGRRASRVAIPVEELEQAFAYRHLVAADAWMVRVVGGGGATPAPWKPLNGPVKLASAGITRLEIPVPPRFAGGIQLQLSEAPEGISIQSVTPGRGVVSVALKVEPEKARPGLRGNLIVEAFREAAPANQPRRRQPIGTLPAIPFEVADLAR